jgi:hypothetical protein
MLNNAAVHTSFNSSIYLYPSKINHSVLLYKNGGVFVVRSSPLPAVVVSFNDTDNCELIQSVYRH